MADRAPFRTLSTLLEEWEGGGREVRSVRPREDDLVESEELVVDVDLSVPVCPPEKHGTAVTDAVVREDGSVAFTFETDFLPGPRRGDDVDVTVGGTRLTAVGTLDVSLIVRFPLDERDTGRPGSAGTERESTAGRPDDPGHTGSVPPFEDEELLREAYETCETFAEMADRIGMDVTAETVRRYMIDAGIHEPVSYDTSRTGRSGDADGKTADAGPGSDAGTGATGPDEAIITDGMGLPDGVTVDTLVETIRASSTLYEVQADIGIGRERALDMLKAHNLLDLVVGRLDTKAQREVSRAEIIDRLRDASASR